MFDFEPNSKREVKLLRDAISGGGFTLSLVSMLSTLGIIYLTGWEPPLWGAFLAAMGMNLVLTALFCKFAKSMDETRFP